MQSASKPVTKWSSINDQVNQMIKWLLLILIGLCAIAATTQYFWVVANTLHMISMEHTS
jgi:hypothetical protein